MHRSCMTIVNSAGTTACVAAPHRFSLRLKLVNESNGNRHGKKLMAPRSVRCRKNTGILLVDKLSRTHTLFFGIFIIHVVLI
jgi:hypothetical protein